MKEMKFRSYWKSVKKMVYFDDPEFTWSKNGRIGIFIPALNNGGVYMGESIDMQFTGLRSWDGNSAIPAKDAYYGDIIVFTNTEGQRFTHQLWWSDELHCTMVGPMPYYKLHESGFIQPSKLEFEIIGNIHENPELVP